MLNSEITIRLDRRVVALLSSFIFNFVVLFSVGYLYEKQHSLQHLLDKTSPLVVESINQEMMEAIKMRTVGQKNGKKDVLNPLTPENLSLGGKYLPALPKLPSMKAEQKSKNSDQAKQENTAKVVAQKLALLEKNQATNKQQKLDLSSLSLKESEKKVDYRVGKIKALKSINLRGNEIKEFLKNDSMAAPMLSPEANPFIANSGIDVKMEIPEGVDLSELNEYELQFYSFQKRNAMTYISSFYKTLDRFMLENPQVRFPLNSGKETMTGRITFDKEGNIREIKMIRSSNNEKMQGFFEDVLEGINRLPNPPKSIVKDVGQFNIYYTLIING